MLYTLFNLILDSGCFPKNWSEGIIISIYKKGDSNITDNYRGITLVSCISKIFTSILNDRLLKWSQQYNVKFDAQFGLRPGYGTTDAVFA